MKSKMSPLEEDIRGAEDRWETTMVGQRPEQLPTVLSLCVETMVEQLPSVVKDISLKAESAHCTSNGRKSKKYELTIQSHGYN